MEKLARNHKMTYNLIFFYLAAASATFFFIKFIFTFCVSSLNILLFIIILFPIPLTLLAYLVLKRLREQFLWYFYIRLVIASNMCISYHLSLLLILMIGYNLISCITSIIPFIGFEATDLWHKFIKMNTIYCSSNDQVLIEGTRDRPISLSSGGYDSGMDVNTMETLDIVSVSSGESVSGMDVNSEESINRMRDRAMNIGSNDSPNGLRNRSISDDCLDRMRDRAISISSSGSINGVISGHANTLYFNSIPNGTELEYIDIEHRPNFTNIPSAPWLEFTGSQVNDWLAIESGLKRRAYDSIVVVDGLNSVSFDDCDSGGNSVILYTKHIYVNNTLVNLDERRLHAGDGVRAMIHEDTIFVNDKFYSLGRSRGLTLWQSFDDNSGSIKEALSGSNPYYYPGQILVVE